MKVQKVDFQLCSDPDGGGTILEFLNEKKEPFMEISISKENSHQVMLYKSLDEHVVFPLSDLIKGIEVAKEKVKSLEFE